MRIPRISKQKRYFIIAVTGTILVLGNIYFFAKAYPLNDNYETFMRGFAFAAWSIYAVHYWLLYRKERKSVEQ